MDAKTGQPQTAVTRAEADTGQPPAAVLQRLLERPKPFTFFQAVRLLMQAHAHEWESTGDFLRHGLAIRPELSLAHPETDITDLKRCDQPEPAPAHAAASGQETGTAGRAGTAAGHAGKPHYAMTVTFLALYGASSPLPSFYTEELIEEARNDHDESRRFLDIFNQSLYVLYYRAFSAGRLGLRTIEEKDERIARLLQALSGFGFAREDSTGCADWLGALPADLSCIPLLTRHTRSARGLAVMLQFLLGRSGIDIEQCLPRVIPVPGQQRARLGGMRLGEDVIGATVTDQEGAFRIHVYQVCRAELSDYLPGGEKLARMHAIVQRYLYLPLAWDLVLHLADNATRPARLGMSTLGVSAFVCETQQVPARRFRIAAHLRADSGPCTGSTVVSHCSPQTAM